MGNRQRGGQAGGFDAHKVDRTGSEVIPAFDDKIMVPARLFAAELGTDPGKIANKEFPFQVRKNS